ncbi:MAG: VapC family ribonuclease [Thermodesulfobacterium sp.]|uniref:VapC family ribonuclease n=1 Tax=Candidatus Thermodesulfobacterium syntrophicum TaxID=3060442 RepID=A0AAE3TFX3_9BACT|nr:VapC family ribonuclease [Candidatus Thermodesulfobacterium syntrophicum]
MQQKKECLIDTNVILRFLLNDVAEQAERAKKLFEAVEIGVEKVYLTDLVLSEIQ